MSFDENNVDDENEGCAVRPPALQTKKFVFRKPLQPIYIQNTKSEPIVLPKKGTRINQDYQSYRTTRPH